MQIDKIGKGISSRRKQLGLSQEDLAGLIGVTRQAVSRWESGTALPSVDNMIELSRVLKVSVDDLLLLTDNPREDGLSAQSVGILLDEYSARQEKRFKHLTIALAVSAACLALGIVLSMGIGLLRSNLMEAQLNDRITATNNQLASNIDSLNTRLSTTIEQALDEGTTLLTDSGYHASYDHDRRAFIIDLYACPKILGTYSNAAFSLVLADNVRYTADAQMVNGRFEGSILIPDDGQEHISGEAYVSWQENAETHTERIRFYDIWTHTERLIITSAWLDTQERQGQVLSVKPWTTVFLSYDARETYPVSIRYDIYAGETLCAAVTQDWPVQRVLTSSDFSVSTITHTPSEAIALDGVSAVDTLMLRVTVTDAQGREFVKEYRPGED